MTVIVAVIYYAFGVDFALLWALLFFVMSFVPNIGFVLAVIPPFLVTMLESGFWTAVVVLLLVIVANTIVDSLIGPHFMSRSVGLSTLMVFLSLILWLWVLGGVGALIAVPMTLMVKHLFFDSYESTRPLSEFMASGVLEEHRKRSAARKTSRGRRGVIGGDDSPTRAPANRDAAVAGAGIPVGPTWLGSLTSRTQVRHVLAAFGRFVRRRDVLKTVVPAELALVAFGQSQRVLDRRRARDPLLGMRHGQAVPRAPHLGDGHQDRILSCDSRPYHQPPGLPGSATVDYILYRPDLVTLEIEEIVAGPLPLQLVGPRHFRSFCPDDTSTLQSLPASAHVENAAAGEERRPAIDGLRAPEARWSAVLSRAR